MKHYEFMVVLSGDGDTPEEAWNEACEEIAQDGLGPYCAECTPTNIVTIEED